MLSPILTNRAITEKRTIYQIRGPSGSSITGIVPTNAYPCLPSPEFPDKPSYIVIGANSDSIYNRMMTAMGREDLIGPNYEQNHHRVARQKEIEDAIRNWTGSRTAEEVEKVMREASVPAGQVFSIKELAENEHVNARGILEDVWVGDKKNGWNLKVAKVTPILDGCDMPIRWAGPDLGQHNRQVLVEELGLTEDELTSYQQNGVVGQDN